MTFKNFLIVARAFAVLLLVAVGSIIALFATYLLVSLVYEMAWRLSRGLLVWKDHATTVAYIIFLAMLSVLCFILAHAIFRWRWSQRTHLLVAYLSTAVGLAFFIFVGYAILTYSSIR